jgi:hypothetical protein
MQCDFGMVLSPILGGWQLVLFLYQQCFWTILCIYRLWIYDYNTVLILNWL